MVRRMKGIYSWILLRVSALLIALYLLYLIIFWFLNVEKMNYVIWRDFFASARTKCFTSLTLLSILVHGVIGIWQVLTDYVQLRAIRIILQLVNFILLLGYVVYGMVVIWSV
ncbi:MAG: succinate dehydrogenase, hydrophobic membrane anchor protein [Candidatus Dasytiphilus stammeri]